MNRIARYATAAIAGYAMRAYLKRDLRDSEKAFKKNPGPSPFVDFVAAYAINRISRSVFPDRKPQHPTHFKRPFSKRYSPVSDSAFQRFYRRGEY